MVEINELKRVCLRDFKPFFTEIEKLKRAAEAALQKHPEQEYSINNKFREAVSHIKGTYKLREDTEVTILPEVNSYRRELTHFSFRWRAMDGENKVKFVAVTKRPSNLGKGDVYYFVCPYSGRLCRKLYTDGYLFTSRWAFNHTYSDRNLSKRNRDLFRVVDAMRETDREERYRKEYYRGKLTPYGRRRRKLYSIMGGYISDPKNGFERADFETRAILAPRRGRPPKMW